jgi:hypothetical protein
VHAARVGLLVMVCVGGCGTCSKPASAPAVDAAIMVTPAPNPGEPGPAGVQPPLPRAPGGRPRLHLTLRSTPPGAAASIDGRLVGTTPVRWEMDDDGRAHDFAFVLQGYRPWRLRFSPSHDGVVHAPLEAVPDEDAGVTPPP